MDPIIRRAIELLFDDERGGELLLVERVGFAAINGEVKAAAVVVEERVNNDDA